jgi:hypothetical protein
MFRPVQVNHAGGVYKGVEVEQIMSNYVKLCQR